MKPKYLLAAVALSSVILLGSCAILGAASKAQYVLTSEEDPDFAAAELPTLMLASQALLEADPKDQAKVVQTASLYIMYANAFIQDPATLLPDERYEERQAAYDRAGASYRRAFRLLSGALERRSPGIVEKAVAGDADFSRFGKGDAPLLYWSAASVLAGFSLNPLDFKSARYLGAAPRFLARADQLDPGWNEGAIQSLFMSFYAGMPDYLGGDLKKAQEYYTKALAYSKGGTASLLVSYATGLCVPKEDYEGFKAALSKALAIDPDARPEGRLETVMAQRKAKRLLEEAGKYFVLTEGDQP
jgi:Predicted integral membrane protein